eukprot:5073373-Pleurochrysis_carterae.AAC.2
MKSKLVSSVLACPWSVTLQHAAHTATLLHYKRVLAQMHLKQTWRAHNVVREKKSCSKTTGVSGSLYF